MSIPVVTEFRIPLLQLCGDGKDRTLMEAADELAKVFHLTEQERAAVLPSNNYPVVRHRTGWAAFHLRKAGLLVEGVPGLVKITPEGKKFLATKPKCLSKKVLLQFPGYQAWDTAQRGKAGEDSGDPHPTEEATKTPEEMVDEAFKAMHARLAAELLERIMTKSSRFFEHLVIDLLLAMGYGGSREEAGQVTRASGDGGIDGVINEDRLGLDAVYVQAKRWEGNVGVEQIRAFVGALSEHKAHKGVFITTSDFAKGARDYVQRVGQKIVLLNGTRLTSLMVLWNIGVSEGKSYAIKQADEEYFGAE